MTTLGNIDKVKDNITTARLNAVKALHVVAYGSEAQPRLIRRRLREFSGFGLEKDSNEYKERVNGVKEAIDDSDLVSICNILDLDYKGTTEDLVDRVCSFMNDLRLSEAQEDEEEEEEEVAEDEYYENDDEDEDEDEPLVNVQARLKSSRNSFALTFRDIEDSIRTFDGKADYPIRTWISDFEEIAEVTGWNDLQRLIFAKKSLTGLAKLFIQSEKGIKTWKRLKQKLIEEFEVKISSVQVHRLLMTRIKKKEESVQEYILVMREIGGRANIDPEVIIQCIIDGIQDEVANKVILYGARTFTEFKGKVKLYEQIKSTKFNQGSSYKNPPPRNDDKGKRRFENNHPSPQNRNRVGNCFNCGEVGHKSATCPKKDQGIKCFSCNGFGHVASRCPKKTGTGSNVHTMEVIPKNGVNLTFEEVQLIALVDTGSDISALRQDVFDTHFTDTQLDKNPIAVRGLGLNKIQTLGSFTKDALVDGEEVNLRFHIIPNNATGFKAILGNDILSQVDINISNSGISVVKKQNGNFMMQITLDESKEFDEIDLNHIENQQQRKEIKKVFDNYAPDKCKSTNIEMKIVVKNESPIYQSPRRLAAPEKLIVEKQLQEWLTEGIIRPSSSEYVSPIVLVAKKDGQTRICCDYRKINKIIVKDRFPLPLIEDVLDRLQGAKYFSTIDLRNGFFHVPIAEDSIKYTAFVTHDGQYEFLKCPFGLCNSPAVFQRYISHIFRELTMQNIVLYYMDDLIITSADEVSGMERLKMVLSVAKDYGLEIKRKKCQILKKRVAFLGFIIENGQVQPSTEKTKAVEKFPRPRTLKQVQSFLGLTGYFRKFIPSYSVIAKPLSDLLKKENIFKFEEEQERSFNKLKELLTCEPVLHIYKQGNETELHTDASKQGYGACLLQRSDDDGKLHPIYYMSRKTTPAEEKYSSYELEVLAIIAAVKKFRIYLLGNNFRIITDCAAFQKTMDKKDLTTRVARWALLLEEYTYEIVHRKGTQMAHVDALSRCPANVMTINEILLNEDGILRRIQLAQSSDDYIQSIKKILEKEETYEDYFLKNETLYKYDRGRELLVVPKAMQSEIIRKSHDIGHFGIGKTEEVVKREFFINKLREKIQTCIRNCIPCILGNRKEGKKEGLLHPIPKMEGPLNTYHVDHLGPLPSTSKRYNHIFVVIDDFSKFCWLYSTKSTTSGEVIKCLQQQQKVFGNPTRIISDRGTAFTSEEFRNYCQKGNIQHVLITTGVPRSNGQVERVNRVIVPILTKLSLNEPSKWYKFIDRVQLALNSSVQRSIGATPFEVLIGVKMKTEHDMVVKEMLEKEIVEDFNTDREKIREESKKQIAKVQEENRKTYNLRRRNPKLYKKGDLVAIKRTQCGPGLKVCSKFLGPYEITKVKGKERYDVIKLGHHEGPMKTSTCSEFIKPWVENASESESDSESDGRM